MIFAVINIQWQRIYAFLLFVKTNIMIIFYGLQTARRVEINKNVSLQVGLIYFENELLCNRYYMP